MKKGYNFHLAIIRTHSVTELSASIIRSVPTPGCVHSVSVHPQLKYFTTPPSGGFRGGAQGARPPPPEIYQKQGPSILKMNSMEGPCQMNRDLYSGPSKVGGRRRFVAASNQSHRHLLFAES